MRACRMRGVERGIFFVVAQDRLDLVERRIERDVQIALVAPVGVASLAALDLEGAGCAGPERGGGEHGERENVNGAWMKRAR